MKIATCSKQTGICLAIMYLFMPLEVLAAPLSADGRIQNETAVFSGLDKTTGRIVSFDVHVNETVQFGALQVTPRVCYTKPATEKPETIAFVNIDEITLDKKIRGLFRGWFFADSPGISAVEHPIYDVWLANCKKPIK